MIYFLKFFSFINVKQNNKIIIYNFFNIHNDCVGLNAIQQTGEGWNLNNIKIKVLIIITIVSMKKSRKTNGLRKTVYNEIQPRIMIKFQLFITFYLKH